MAAAGAALLLGAGDVRAASDSYASGFYTRGVDAAAYLDQGGAVVDPFYVPAKTCALLPRVTLAITHEDNVFLDPTNETAGTSIALVPGLLAIWGRPAGNHLYADYGLSLPVYESERDVDDRPATCCGWARSFRTGKSQVAGHGAIAAWRRSTPSSARGSASRIYLADLGLEHRFRARPAGGCRAAPNPTIRRRRLCGLPPPLRAGRIYHRATAKSRVFVQGGLGRDDPRKRRRRRGARRRFLRPVAGSARQAVAQVPYHRTDRLHVAHYDDERRADFSMDRLARRRKHALRFTTFTADL
jgi:hypothetical protein